MSNDYTIAAVVRTLSILKLFDKKHKKMTLTEISERSGVVKSSVLRVLASCEAEGFIKYDEETKLYRLGVEIFKLANTGYDFMDIRQVAMPFIRKMVNEMNLIGHLGVVEGDKVVIIAKVWPESTADSLALQSRVGGIVPTHCTGIGKVITAFSEPETSERLINSCSFERYTEHTVCDRDEFEKVLDRVRKQGYAVTVCEHEPLIQCITYPIFGINGQLIAAMSLTGLTHSYNEETEAKAKEMLRMTAQMISNEMGG